MGGEVRNPTTTKARVGTQPAAYHLQVSTAKVRVKRTYGTSFAIETHAVGLRTVAKSEIALSTSAVMIGTMISMASTMTSLTDTVLRLEDTMKGDQALFS
jgi:hypothetical protein